MFKPSLLRDSLIALAAFLVIAALPMFWPSRGFSDFVVRLAAFGIFATSLNLLVGYGGMESFGHGLFFGLGCYSFGLIMQNFPVSIPVALLATVAISALVSRADSRNSSESHSPSSHLSPSISKCGFALG